MSSKVKFSKISQMPSVPEKDAIYFLKTPTNRMKIIVTSNDETPEPIETEYGLCDYSYSNGSVSLSSTALTVNRVTDISTSGAYIDYYVTDDGTSTGTPIFSDLRLCHLTPLIIPNAGYASVFIISMDHTTHRIEFGIMKANMSVTTNAASLLENNSSVTLRLQISGPAYE